MLLVSAILGGGAWYLNATGVLSGLSSSAIPQFVCTENNLKKQASYYRQTQIRRRKALVIEKQLETEISTLRAEDKLTEMQEKQANFRILIRQIATYNRFIKAYDACQKKTPTTIEIVPPVTTAPVVPVSVPTTTEWQNTSPITNSITTPTAQNTSSSQPVVSVPPIVTIPSTTEYIPETTEALTTAIPETTEAPATTAIPETTEAPNTTEVVAETTEAPTTEYIPETTQSPQTTSSEV